MAEPSSSAQDPPGRSPVLVAGSALLGLAVLVAIALGLRHEARPFSYAPQHPDILLVTFDTTRADHTSAYGYHRPTTPRIEEVARDGIQLDAAYAPMATTTPSHASMFTSLVPRTHGLTRNGMSLSGKPVTLAEILDRAGYRTHAVVSSYPVSREFGLARGFATYDDHFEEGQGSKVDSKRGSGETRWEGMIVKGAFDRRGNVTREHAIDWLETNGGLAPAEKSGRPPYFLWVHFFDPHHPYNPPADEAALFPPEGDSELAGQIARYDADIHFADRQLGILLDRLRAAGTLDRTLVVVAGDHGEGLGDHGWLFHGLMIYEEAVHVPLIVRWPAGLPRGRHQPAPVELIDLAPTILDLAGVAERPPAAQGKSIAPVLRGTAKDDPERLIFLERRSYVGKEFEGRNVSGEKTAVRAGRWKYIEAPAENDFELYDLSSDPKELDNRYDAERETATRLADMLAAWRRTTPVAPPEQAPVKPDSAEKLRALGYVQ